MLIATFSALAALALSGGMNMAQAHGNPPAAHVHGNGHADLTPKAVAFEQQMRKLWEDHITWTRLAIISLEGGTPDTDATVARLLQNQVDIGNAFQPYYGTRTAHALTQLLREHILIAADVIAAAKAGDAAKLADAQARWTQNADQIASALHSVNPHFWKLGEMQAEMHMHLALTTQEAVARLHADWAGDVAAYDRVHLHILHMADLLSEGVIDQSSPGASGKDRRSRDTNRTCRPRPRLRRRETRSSAGAATSSPPPGSVSRSPPRSPPTVATTCTL